MMSTPAMAPPAPTARMDTDKPRLTELDPQEIAHQLTLIESRLFQAINPAELLERDQGQTMEGKDQDNIARVIELSNWIASWVTALVLEPEDSTQRAAVVKHFVCIADRCEQLNNFSSMIAIATGLNTPPITRLDRTWEQVAFPYVQKVTGMAIDGETKLTSYRQRLANATPPCIPFIGIHLATLLHIQVGGDSDPPDGLANSSKHQRTEEVINDVKRWQAQAYDLRPVPLVASYIEESLSQFNGKDTLAQSESFWQLSLEREPREREDERMARLLRESGFI